MAIVCPRFGFLQEEDFPQPWGPNSPNTLKSQSPTPKASTKRPCGVISLLLGHSNDRCDAECGSIFQASSLASSPGERAFMLVACYPDSTESAQPQDHSHTGFMDDVV